MNSIPTEAAQSPCKDDAEWLRIPDACNRFGLSRTKLYQLAKQGKIRSVSLREEGQAKATRLFHAGSLRSYIESFETERGS